MAYVDVSFSRPNGRHSLGKPLFYPSELRGHGPGTLGNRYNLRKAPLALTQVQSRVLATVGTSDFLLAALAYGMK